MIILKSKREIELMKAAGEIAGTALHLAGEAVRSGISTFELDSLIKKYILSKGATPSFLNYAGFPSSSCISVNDVVIHGIPSKDVIIKDGDIVSIDVGAFYNGFHGDTAYTFKCGNVSDDVQRLLDTTRESLVRGIEKAVVGNKLGDIGSAVQEYVESRNCSVVMDFVGHGVGRKLHESPSVPNFGEPSTGPRLQSGMTIAIEPMVIMGNSGDVEILDDEWTTVSASGNFAAHFEHTVAITENGPLILTKV